MIKKVATTYKDKHFVIEDEDQVDDSDYIDEYVDVEKIIASDDLLYSHVMDCIYYGIPAYLGRDEDLKRRIEVIYKNYNEKNSA